MGKMIEFAFRFNDAYDADLAARALRRRGFQVRRRDNTLAVQARDIGEVSRAMQNWALHRGRLPVFVLIDMQEVQ